MRFRFITLAIIAITLFTAAEFVDTSKIKWGGLAPKLKGTQDRQFIGSINSELILLWSDKVVKSYKDYSLEFFSKDDLSFSRKVPFSFPDSTRKWHIKIVTVIEGQIYTFLERYNKSEKKHTLYLYRMNPSGQLEKGIIVEEVKHESRRMTSKFYIEPTKDKKNLLVYAMDDYDPKNIKMKYLNTDLVEVWGKKLELPFTDHVPIRSKLKVDQNGDVFFWIVTQPNEGKEKEKLKQRKLRVLHYAHKADELSELDMGLENVMATSIEFGFNEAGDMVVAGLYTKNESNGALGYFSTLFDKDTRSPNYTLVKDFEKPLIVNEIGEKEAAKGNGLNHFYMKNIFVKEDGSSYILLEYWEVVVKCSETSSGSKTCNYRYYCKDIMVVSIGKDGVTEWLKMIPKSQSGYNDNGVELSFYVQMVDDVLNIFFNEGYPGKLSHCQVDRSGNLTQRMMVDYKAEKITLYPQFFYKENAREFLVYHAGRKGYKVGRISL